MFGLQLGITIVFIWLFSVMLSIIIHLINDSRDWESYTELVKLTFLPYIVYLAMSNKLYLLKKPISKYYE